MSVAGKTYVFNDNLVLIGFTPFEINVRFIVNGNSLMVCDDIHSFFNDRLMYMFQLYGSQTVYSESATPTKWDYPSLKTIRFLEDPAEGLSTLESFLSVNATENPVTNYLITDASLYQIADNLRVKTGTANPLELVDDFISEIEKLTDTRDATAVAGDLRSGKTAYVDGSKVSGNLTGKAAATYNTSSSDQTIASGQILDGVQTIKAVTTSNIDAGNIKKGVVVKVGDANSAGRIKDVTGTYGTATVTEIDTGYFTCTHESFTLSSSTPGYKVYEVLSYNISSYIPSGGKWAGCTKWYLGNVPSGFSSAFNYFVDIPPDNQTASIFFVVKNGASSATYTVPANSLKLRLYINVVTVT